MHMQRICIARYMLWLHVHPRQCCIKIAEWLTNNHTITFTVYVTACDLKKCFSFNTMVKIKGHVQFLIQDVFYKTENLKKV